MVRATSVAVLKLVEREKKDVEAAIQARSGGVIRVEKSHARRHVEEVVHQSVEGIKNQETNAPLARRCRAT